MNGFRNQTPDEAIFEVADSVQDKLEKYHRIVIPRNLPSVEAEGSRFRSQDGIDDLPRGHAASVDSVDFNADNDADDMSVAESSTAQHGSKWGPVSSAVALAWDPDEKCLYTGDELGYLRKWSLEALIKELMKNNSQATTTVVGVEDELSQENVLTAAVKVLSALGSMGNHAESKTKRTGVFEWAVSAHEESILYCCRCPSGIFTSSTDRLVKIWSFQGYPIGQLFHSVPTGVRNEYWNLELDVKRLMEAENKELDEVMADVSEFIHRPDVPEIDKSNLTSMVPGFEAAKYSQSSFRKIIDRSGLILGIDLDEQHQDQPDDLSIQSQSSKSSQDALKELKGKYRPDKKKKKLLNEADSRRHANNLKKVADKYGKSENGTKLPYVKLNVGQTIPEDDDDQQADQSQANSLDVSDAGAAAGAGTVLSHKEKTAATDDAKQRARNAEIDRKCKKYTSFTALDEALLGKPASSIVSQAPSRSASVDITAIRQKRLSTITILTQSNGGRKNSRLPSLSGNLGTGADGNKLPALLSMSMSMPMSALSTFNRDEGERSGVFDGEGERSGPIDAPIERQSSAISEAL